MMPQHPCSYGHIFSSVRSRPPPNTLTHTALANRQLPSIRPDEQRGLQSWAFGKPLLYGVLTQLNYINLQVENTTMDRTRYLWGRWFCAAELVLASTQKEWITTYGALSSSFLLHASVSFKWVSVDDMALEDNQSMARVLFLSTRLPNRMTVSDASCLTS